MSQTLLRLASQSAFDTVREFFRHSDPLVLSQPLPANLPAAVESALRETGLVDRQGIAQWGLSTIDGFLLLHDAAPPPIDDPTALLPPSRVDRILVWKAGAGHTALAASRHADFVIAVESSPRLRQLLEFQLRLNGLANVIIRPGVEDRSRFPWIAVPNVQQEAMEATLDAAGARAKSHIRTLTKAIHHLEPGGTLLAKLTVSIRSGVSVDKQMRDWVLGADDCHFALFQTRERSTVEFAVAMLRSPTPPAQTLEACLDLLAQADAARALDAVLALQKPTQTQPPYSVFRVPANPADIAAMHRFLHWQQRCEAPGSEEALLAARPRLQNNWKVLQRYQPQDGAFTAGRESLLVDAPFQSEFPFPPWLKSLLLLIDGVRTCQEIFAALHAAENVKQKDFFYAMKLLGGYEVILVD